MFQKHLVLSQFLWFVSSVAIYSDDLLLQKKIGSKSEPCLIVCFTQEAVTGERGTCGQGPPATQAPPLKFKLCKETGKAMKLTCQVSWFCPTPKTRPIIESPLFGLCTVPPNLYTFILGLKTAQLNFLSRFIKLQVSDAISKRPASTESTEGASFPESGGRYSHLRVGQM